MTGYKSQHRKVLSLCEPMTAVVIFAAIGPVAHQSDSRRQIEPAPDSGLTVISHWSPAIPPPLPPGCSDADADGYSPDGGECGPIDCDDTDPQRHPNAREICDGIDNDCDGEIEQRYLDNWGDEFCLDLVFDTGSVGNDIPVRIYAYHSAGLRELKYIPTDSGLVSSQVHNCGYSQYCQFDAILPAREFAGHYVSEVWAYRDSIDGSSGYIGQAAGQCYVACPEEYCAPDTLYSDFITWMRLAGYAPAIVSYYAELRLNVGAYETYRWDLRRANADFETPFYVDFYDVIPTDSEATYTSLASGEGNWCQPEIGFEDWCPTAARVDYEYIEQHFEQTFGFDIEFNYIQRLVDYSDSIAEPVYEYGEYRFYMPFSFRNSFPPTSIVHMAIDTWNDTAVFSLGMGGWAAFVYRNGATAHDITVFTHEWGHAMGLRHSFYSNPQLGNGYIGLNGVMDNTYRPNLPPYLDPADPLERYLFEPAAGHLDAPLFALNYNDYMIGTARLPGCGQVDPEIVEVTVLDETSASLVYELTLANLGNVPISYVPLAAYDSLGILPFEERLIYRLDSGELQPMQFTVQKSSVPSGAARFVLDPDNIISEISEDPDAGCPTEFTCGDINRDLRVADLSDLLYLVNHLFLGGPPPLILASADVNGKFDGIDISDLTYLVNYLFLQGPPLSCPSQ